MNREAWLGAVIRRSRPIFRKAGFPLPKNIAVSVGWNHRHSIGTYGECWTPCREGSSWQIFISPALEDNTTVVVALLHELVHTAVGFDAGHRGTFIELAGSLGFDVPWTECGTTPALETLAQTLTTPLGRFPHEAIRLPARRHRTI